MAKLSPELAFIANNMNLKQLFNGGELEPHQVVFLNSDDKFTIDVKSRQIGWSTTIAIDAIASAHVNPKQTHIIISYTREEAANKIDYATAVYEAILRNHRLKLTNSSRTSLTFSNGSRIISHPCKPPRGYSKAKIYGDEMAFWPDDATIYNAMLPIIVRGGSLRLGSTPFGTSNLFYELVINQANNFKKRELPWWVSPALCISPNDKHIPNLPTEQRVATFGTDALKLIYESLTENAFRIEFECAFIEDAESFLTAEEVKAAQVLDMNEGLDCARTIDSFKPERAFYVGVDIGRYNHTTEIFCLDESGHLVAMLRVRNKTFQFQQKLLQSILAMDTCIALAIDSTGLGMHLAEDLENESSKVIRVPFSNSKKNILATGLKKRFENKAIHIPMDKDLFTQLTSVKSLLRSTKFVTFEVSSKAHHADMFWALALAVYAHEQDSFQDIIVC